MQPEGTPFGHLLREYRIRAGLSQEHLAEQAKISTAAVGALERGVRRSPYRSTVSLLARALRLTAEECAALEAARRGDKSQPAKSSVAGHFHGARTSFIGRDADVARIVKLLGKSRLVTVTGAGGVGKTRAEVAAARYFVDFARMEAAFVDLSPLTDGAFIPASIASALAPPLTDPVDTIAGLASALNDRRALLIFDNCEHTIAEAAAAVDVILDRCPQIAILATSRERLNIAGEFVYALPALSLPESVPNGVEEAQSYAAIDLFVQRAEAADPHFVFDAENLRGVVDVVRRLDGMPLAIELAAAQLPVLGLQALLLRLNEQFTVPAGRRDLPPRQQTIAATIRWSYELLTSDERQLLCDVSIFSGGFTLDAAEAVRSCGSFDRSSILSDLSSLVNKSLVNVGQVRDGVRYALLDSVRAFAFERLREAGNEASASRRHAEWLANLADSYGRNSSWQSPKVIDDSELGNVRAAISWSLNAQSADDPALAGRIVNGFGAFWARLGRRREHQKWIETALNRIDELRHPGIVVDLLTSFMIRAHADPNALPAAQRAIALLPRIDDRYISIRLHVTLTMALTAHGKLAEAEQSSELALELMTAEEKKSTWYATLLLSRCVLRQKQGRFDDARSDIAAVETLALLNGDRYLVAARCWPRLLWLEYRAGHISRALEIAERMLASEFGSSPEVAYQALTCATRLRLVLGDANAAAESARALFDQVRRHEGITDPCEYAATVAALRGHGVAAARLMGFARASGERVPVSDDAMWQATRDLLISSLRKLLSCEAIAAACADGASLTEEQATAEALAALKSS